MAKLNKQVESLNLKVTELKLENDTQADLLDHQQTMINNQTNEILKANSEKEAQSEHVRQQNALIEEIRASNKTQED